MFPAYIASARLGKDNKSSPTFENMVGRCFLDIGARTDFVFNDSGTELIANINFDLKESLGLCVEHLQVSTAFSDYYTFYIMGGQKQITL